MNQIKRTTSIIMALLMLSGNTGTVFAGNECTTGNQEKTKMPQAKVAEAGDKIDLSEMARLLCSDEGSDEHDVDCKNSDDSGEATEELVSKTESGLSCSSSDERDECKNSDDLGEATEELVSKTESGLSCSSSDERKNSDALGEPTEELVSKTESGLSCSDSDENCTTNEFYECAKMAYELGVKFLLEAKNTDNLFVKSGCVNLFGRLYVISKNFKYDEDVVNCLPEVKIMNGEGIAYSSEGQKMVSLIVESLKDDIILLGDKFIETASKSDFNKSEEAYMVAVELFSILVDMNIEGGIQKIYECGVKCKDLVASRGCFYKVLAIDCFTRAANKDIMLACFELGNLLESENILNALVYYDKASRLGCKKAELYAFFACVNFERANRCGPPSSTKCEIYYRLGLSHEQGRGGADTDVCVTLNYYLIAMLYGNEYAKKKVQSVRDELSDFDVSKIKFRKSTPEEIDEVERAIKLEADGMIKQAVSVYMKLGNRGCLRAQERLAYCFQNNLIPDSSLLETVTWFKRAALNGSLYSKIVILRLRDLLEKVKN